eukprot:6193498-Pleurochrysis_carterae.AAC.2
MQCVIPAGNHAQRILHTNQLAAARVCRLACTHTLRVRVAVHVPCGCVASSSVSTRHTLANVRALGNCVSSMLS